MPFPSRVLGAGETMVVFASGDDIPDAAGNLHTNFGLSAGGEYVGLFDPDPLRLWDGLNAEEPAGVLGRITSAAQVVTSADMGLARRRRQEPIPEVQDPILNGQNYLQAPDAAMEAYGNDSSLAGPRRRFIDVGAGHCEREASLLESQIDVAFEHLFDR